MFGGLVRVVDGLCFEDAGCKEEIHLITITLKKKPEYQKLVENIGA